MLVHGADLGHQPIRHQRIRHQPIRIHCQREENYTQSAAATGSGRNIQRHTFLSPCPRQWRSRHANARRPMTQWAGQSGTSGENVGGPGHTTGTKRGVGGAEGRDTIQRSRPLADFLLEEYAVADQARAGGAWRARRLKFSSFATARSGTNETFSYRTTS